MLHQTTIKNKSMDAAIETLKEKKFYLEFRLEENKDESLLIQKIITKKINQLDYAIKLLELNLNYLK